jgi:hypothetical protein
MGEGREQSNQVIALPSLGFECGKGGRYREREEVTGEGWGDEEMQKWGDEQMRMKSKKRVSTAFAQNI